MKTKSSRFVDFMVFLLLVLYVVSYFLPSHYGVKCSVDLPPLGSTVLVTFYIVWTFFTVGTIKNDPSLKVKESTWKELWETTKRLSFHEYEGEYDHDTMCTAQR
jgi:hypothetical protein